MQFDSGTRLCQASPRQRSTGSKTRSDLSSPTQPRMTHVTSLDHVLHRQPSPDVVPLHEEEQLAASVIPQDIGDSGGDASVAQSPQGSPNKSSPRFASASSSPISPLRTPDWYETCAEHTPTGTISGGSAAGSGGSCVSNSTPVCMLHPVDVPNHASKDSPVPTARRAGNGSADADGSLCMSISTSRREAALALRAAIRPATRSTP